MVDWNDKVRFQNSNYVMDQSSLKFVFPSIDEADELILKSISKSFILDEPEKEDAMHEKNWILYEKVKRRLVLYKVSISHECLVNEDNYVVRKLVTREVSFFALSNRLLCSFSGVDNRLKLISSSSRSFQVCLCLPVYCTSSSILTPTRSTIEGSIRILT